MSTASQKRSRQDDDQEILPDTTSLKRSRMNNPSSEPTTAPISSRNQSTATSPSSSSSSAEPNDKDANHNRARTSNTKYNRRIIARQRKTREPSDATNPSSSDESTSSEGTSSDEEDEDPDSDEDANVNGSDGEPSLPHIPGRQKPRIHRVEKNSDILSRVSAFLPRMKDANESLEREIAAGRGKDLRLDDVDDEHKGRYIEMNLGLGVLEEKRPDDNGSPDSDRKGEMSDSEEEQGAASSKQQRDSNVMGKLMGNKTSTSKKPTIEEMNQ